MLIDRESKNRYAVYVFYDKNGIADDYIPVFLEGLSKVCTKVLVVVNGSITDESRRKIEPYCSGIMQRPNEGYDVTAYKEGILKPGFDELSGYDEVIICNDTIYGPLYPFEEMFSEMAGRDLDFWGLTKFHKYPGDPFGTIEYGYIPTHLQSFFHVYRKSLTSTKDFRDFWTNLPVISGYEQAIGTFEAVFTKKFEEKGYKWAAYADSTELEGSTHDPLRDYPLYMIKNKRCPVMKKRSFYHEYMEAMERSGGEATRDAFDYVRRELGYDEGLIWKNILRTQNMADIKKRLHLDFVVSARKPRRTVKSSLRLAMIIHIYYPDLAETCRKYAMNMPEGTDMYITVPDEKTLQIVRAVFTDFPYKTEYRVTGNIGRDVAPFVVGCKDVVDKYDLICKIHDKKVKQLEQLSIGQSWGHKCYQCLVKNKIFVENIISLFEEEPYLGILSPPVPMHGPYYPTIGKGEWGDNFACAKELADKLGLTVDLDPDKEPVAPLGSLFWFRPKALAPLFAHDWTYDEMPPEPIPDDNTVLHAIERIYPFCAQQAGYYSAWSLSGTFAAIELNNMDYLNHTLREAEIRSYGERSFREIRDAIKRR